MVVGNFRPNFRQTIAKRMLRYLFCLTFYWALLAFDASAQTSIISGIINNYTAVDSVKICQKQLQVQSNVGFNVGDRILLIQMQGATINTANTSSFGTINSLNEAGNYEFNAIAAIAGNFIYLKYAITRNYNVAQKVQLGSVPVYPNASVSSDVTGQPWNGNTGGIIAMEVTGLLNLSANINVSELGFRGGITNSNVIPYSAANCGFTDYFTALSTANGAQKGEGIAAYQLNAEYARGAQANGGGGGNQINAGGAGGGNFAIGGNGGNQMSACPGTVQGGQGGKSITYSNVLNKVFLGGGGGAGHQDNSIQATDGKAGGGIVFIKADNLSGNGFSIKANGGNQLLIAGFDGAGGGGGAGAVLLEVNNFTTNIQVEVKGGIGGTVSNNNANCHGPGGGGGGGLIWYKGVGTLPALITPLFNGGTPGVFLSPKAPCNNSTAGALTGASGSSLNALKLVYDTLFNLISAGKDTSVCPGNPITLNASAGGSNYIWTPTVAFVNPNMQSPTVILVTATTTYAVSAVDMLGCINRDTIKVSLANQAIAIVSGNATVCNGTPVTISANGGDNYVWYPATGLNATNTSSVIANPLTTTTYYVYITTLPNTCPADTGTIVVTVANTPTVDAGPDIYLPQGSMSVINAVATNTASFTSYAWTPANYLSDTTMLTPVTAATQEVRYHILVSNGLGCEANDSVTVHITDVDIVMLNAFSPDNDGVNDVYRIANYNFSSPFKMDIYNRWGEIVFSSTDPKEGWDGNYKGSPLPIDAYTYRVTYQLATGLENKSKTGSITLLRGH